MCCQGVLKIFRAPIHRAHRVVIFAIAQLSCSTIKRVKTYLRSTMTDQKLNNLCLLAVEREMSHDLLSDPSSVVDKFALLRDRRLSFV